MTTMTANHPHAFMYNWIVKTAPAEVDPRDVKQVICAARVEYSRARAALTGQASPVANENGETTFKRSRELDRRWGSDLVEKVIAFGMTAISERAKEQGGFLAYDPFEDMGLAAWMRPIIREHLEQFTS